MAIMHMVVVACLGMKKAPGRRAERPRKESPKRVRSRRGLVRARVKWSFPLCQTIVKMIPKVLARRDEDVGFGFTSIGVVVEKIRPFVP